METPLEQPLSSNTNKLINTLTGYSKIFSHHLTKPHITSKQPGILFLKKKEFDIYYSTRYKYPILVAENITSLTGLTDPNEAVINRRIIDDPFRQDLDIPNNIQHTLDNYKTFMEYGGSMGHNAPAGHHKTNLNIWNETFLITNITPQEMVFNCGLWALIENWCRNLNRNTRLEKIMVMTGSIPNSKDTNFNGVIMNVPEKMFKIVCMQLQNRPQMTIIEIFIGLNKPFYVNYTLPKFDLEPFLLPHSGFKAFQKESGINILLLLEYYGFNSSRIKPFRDHLNMEINLTPGLKILMRKSKWFGKIIYSRTLDALENNWIECQKHINELQDIKYHQQYYELVKKRLIRDGSANGSANGYINMISGVTPIEFSKTKVIPTPAKSAIPKIHNFKKTIKKTIKKTRKTHKKSSRSRNHSK
jgi:DNA/RNA endonuclease G (NUC1)